MSAFAWSGFDEVQRIASNYVVFLVIDGRVLGSGTLVRAKGIDGILTAHHVAEVPYLKRGGEFSLCIRGDVIHRLDVQTSQFHHLVIGDWKRNRFQHTGPDLSFLIITDHELRSILAGKKLFYPLIQRVNFSETPQDKLLQMPWTISRHYEYDHGQTKPMIARMQKDLKVLQASLAM